MPSDSLPRPLPDGGRWLEWAERLVNGIGILIATGWFLVLFLAHTRMISQPGPQEYNEPAIWGVTWLLDHGRNPYTAVELPAAANAFGPFYNYLVLAFKPLLGADYAAHRLVNLIFLLGSLGLLVRSMVRAGGGWGIALLSVVFYYWMGLQNIMITARPDALGLFFFLLGLLVPWEKNYALGPTIFGLVCAVVAFHGKSYFMLAGCATLLGHFVVRSRREACWLGLGYFSALLLSFSGFWWFFPYYFIETIIMQGQAVVQNMREDVSARHTVMWFALGWPFLLIMLCGLPVWFRRSSPVRESNLEPSGAGHRPGVLGAMFLVFLFLVYFCMGHNAGAVFTYHLHLLFPMMFVLAATAVTHRWSRIGFGLLLMTFVMVKLQIPGVPDSGVPYRHLERLITDTRGEILGIPAVNDILYRERRPVLHDGNTSFITFTFANGGIARDPMIATLARKYDATGEEVTRKVKSRAYALVLTEFGRPYFCSQALLEENYQQVELVEYPTYFGDNQVSVWRPKPW